MIGFAGTSITITPNYNSSQSVTAQDSLHSLLDYECLPFCMTDLVLIYEPVTSSASVVHWLTHQAEHWILSQMLNDWILPNWTLETIMCPRYNFKVNNIDHHLEQFLVITCFAIVIKCAYRLAIQQWRSFHCWLHNLRNEFTETLCSNGHICHSIYRGWTK
jgi:hypothetical protein